MHPLGLDHQQKTTWSHNINERIVGSKHSHRDLLCDDCLAVAPEGVVKWSIEAIVVVWTWCRKGAVRVRGRCSDDSQGKHWHVVLLREAYLGGRSVQGRLEGSVE